MPGLVLVLAEVDIGDRLPSGVNACSSSPTNQGAGSGGCSLSSRLPPHEPALDGDLEPDVDGAVFPEQDEEDEAYFALINTMPTTLAGLAAMIDFMARAFGDNVPYLRSQEATAAFFLVLDESLRRLTGAAS